MHWWNSSLIIIIERTFKSTVWSSQIVSTSRASEYLVAIRSGSSCAAWAVTKYSVWSVIVVIIDNITVIKSVVAVVSTIISAATKYAIVVVTSKSTVVIERTTIERITHTYVSFTFVHAERTTYSGAYPFRNSEA